MGQKLVLREKKGYGLQKLKMYFLSVGVLLVIAEKARLFSPQLKSAGVRFTLESIIRSKSKEGREGQERCHLLLRCRPEKCSPLWRYNLGDRPHQ